MYSVRQLIATSTLLGCNSWRAPTKSLFAGLWAHYSSMAPTGREGKDKISTETQQEIKTSSAWSSESSSIREGLADILVPKKKFDHSNRAKETQDEDSSTQSVFYNPIQQFNRDLSVLAIKAFGEDLLAARKLKAETKTPRGKKRKRQTKTDDSTNPDVSVLEDNVAQRNHEDSQLVDGNKPVSTWKTNFKILDALSATGLRAIRYAKEIPFTTSVVANDMSLKAAEAIKSNIKANGLENKIIVTCDNAMSHMYAFASPPPEGFQRTGKYDVIDLDPYGTAAPFLDAAMQAINDGGLLCVTCTDAGVWASCGYPEKTYAMYGGLPVKGHHSHEAGLRLILHAIASSAARYGLAIEPLLSLSIDFYGRIFVRVVRSQAEVKLLAGKTMLVYTCDSGCGAWTLQPLAQNKTFLAKDGQPVYKHSLAQGPPSSPLCQHCNTKTHISGPMYGGPIHNPEFIKAILGYLPQLDASTYATIERIEGMLSTALEETFVLDGPSSPETEETENTENTEKPEETEETQETEKIEETEKAASTQSSRLVPRIDPAKVDRFPFFFNPSSLAGVIHCRAPSEAALKGALKYAGYRVSKSHAKPGSVKTNAPWTFIWEMMREWARQKAPVKEGSLKPGQAGWMLMKLQDAGSSAERSGFEASSLGKGKIGVGEEVEARQEIMFDEELGRDPNRRRLVRYQVNPRANWGPMHRAPKGKN